MRIVLAQVNTTIGEGVVRLVDRNYHKRRQAAPGLKATTKVFGVGRGLPIAQRLST